MQTLGEVITTFRESQGMTRNELSTKTGISRTEIIRIEENTRKQPSLANLRILSNALHINYVQLLILAKYFTMEELKDFVK